LTVEEGRIVLLDFKIEARSLLIPLFSFFNISFGTLPV